jgi:hypothetical protein
LKDETFEDIRNIRLIQTFDFRTLRDTMTFLDRIPSAVMRLNAATLQFIGMLGDSGKLIHWLKTLHRNDTFEKEIAVCSQSEDRQHVVSILADLQVIRDLLFELGAKESGLVQQPSIHFSKFLERIFHLQEASPKSSLRISANSSIQLETIKKNLNEITQVREDIRLGNIDTSLTRYLSTLTRNSTYQYKLAFSETRGKIGLSLGCQIPNLREVGKQELKSLARSLVMTLGFLFSLLFFFLINDAGREFGTSKSSLSAAV